MDLEQLRQKIKELQTEHEKATMEKGLAAEDNKDLRENFAYDYWVEKEAVLTARIHGLLQEIKSLTNKGVGKVTKPATSKKKKPTDTEKLKEMPKNKWL